MLRQHAVQQRHLHRQLLVSVPQASPKRLHRRPSPSLLHVLILPHRLPHARMLCDALDRLHRLPPALHARLALLLQDEAVQQTLSSSPPDVSRMLGDHDPEGERLRGDRSLRELEAAEKDVDGGVDGGDSELGDELADPKDACADLVERLVGSSSRDAGEDEGGMVAGARVRGEHDHLE
eukprot:196332-Hanusia_phi.AAC.5